MTTSLEFDEFVRVRSHRLLRLAYAFTRDHALAEDLLQTALARAWPAWKRIEGDPEPYVRRVLANTYNSWWRRRWTDEHPTEMLPERVTQHPQGGVDDRDEIRRALARLPRQQRSVLVLRYFVDLSEVEIAEMMGVSPGAVKGYASKALAKLRLDPTLLAASAPESVPEGIERVSAVRQRVRQRSRNRLIVAGAAAAVALAVVAGVLAAGWLRKTPDPHPVQPSPSPSVLRAGDIYFSGQRILLDARDIPLAERRHSLTFTPQAGRRYRVATACAHLATDRQTLVAELRTTMTAMTGHFGESCDPQTDPADLTVGEWTRTTSTTDLSHLTPGVPLTVTVEVVPYKGKTLPDTGMFSVGITEEVAYADYPFPPRPASLKPLRHDAPYDGRRLVFAGGSTVVTMPWTGGLAMRAGSQTPGRLEVSVNGVRFPGADVTFWAYGPAEAGHMEAVEWPEGTPEPARGSIVTIEVQPVDITGDWWAQLAGPGNDWFVN